MAENNTENNTVLFMVHDTDTDRGIADTGTLRDQVAARGYDVEIAHPAGTLPDVAGFDFVVVMGSSEAAYDDSVPWLAAEISYLRAALAANVPILGVCFGGQLLSRVLGGKVKRSDHPEHGYATVTTVAPELVGSGPWMQMHSDRFTLTGAREIARNGAALQTFTFGKTSAKTPTSTRRSPRPSGPPGKPAGPQTARVSWWMNAPSIYSRSPPRSPLAQQNPERTAGSCSTGSGNWSRAPRRPAADHRSR